MLPALDPDQSPDDLLMEVHGTYQKIDFTEEVVETMCKKAAELMQLVSPESLVVNYKTSLDALYIHYLTLGHH
jgi:hypothetical protein